MLKIEVYRKKSSYDFRANPNKPDGFDNNWKNNSQDVFVLKDDKAEMYKCKCQSVANYCFGDMATADTVTHGDTIAEGEFQVRCFADPRSFHGDVHEIIKTRDIDGQWIDHTAMQITDKGFQNGRWLIHTKYSKSRGEDTAQAWSAGCIILSSFDMEGLTSILKAFNVQAGDIINGEIIEED